MDSMPQTRFRSKPAPLSEALVKFSQPGPDGITQRYETAEQLRLFWEKILPQELAQHCRIIDFSQGLLTVEAASPSFLYELRISNQQLVTALRQGCPSARVRAIKVTLAR